MGFRLGDCTTHPHPVLFFLSIKRCVQPLIGCVVETLQTRNLFCFLDQHILQTTDLKDAQISAQLKCTLAHFGLHSNCLHLSLQPCCVSMSLTYTPARAPALSSRPRAQFIKTSAGTNLIPPVWWLSYPAVTHNKIAGQRLAGGSQRSKCQAVTGKPRKCQRLFCCIRSADIWRDIVQLLCLTVPAGLGRV